MKFLFIILLVTSMSLSSNAFPTSQNDDDEMDGEQSRKIIGQSVVTSVSVITNGDGEAPHFADAVGKTVPRPFVPPQVASPINLLNPDRYEFYTFNDSGELVKRLMTLREIQSIVANGNGAVVGENDEPETQSVVLNAIPLSNQGAETRVQDIVENVQSVLSQEIENNKNISTIPSQLLDTPDVSSSWSMILPAIFGNTGDEILPHKPINMTPETEILDTTTTFLPTSTTKKTTMKAAVTKTTKAPTKATVSLTKAPTTVKTTTKQTVKAKPKPSTTRATTSKPIENKTTTAKPKIATTKKVVKKPTAMPARRKPTVPSRPHLTNSPIIIEYIERKPSHGSKPEVVKYEYKTQRVTQAPSTTTQMKTTTVKKVPTTTTTTTMTTTTTTEAPTTTIEVKASPPTTLLTTTLNDQSTLSASEEDRQDLAINQIIGSLQNNLFNSYEVKATTEDMTMEKIGDLSLTPDKVLLNDQLFIEEEDPILKDLPSSTTVKTTTVVPKAENKKPVHEKFEATTAKIKETLTHDSEIVETIEKFIQQQGDGKTKPMEKFDVLGFDDDDETEIDFNESSVTKKPVTQATTTAVPTSSIKYAERQTTLASIEETEEDDTTIPTILSETLSDVIKLMTSEKEAKEKKNATSSTTSPPEKVQGTDDVAIEPSGEDLNKLLQHYEGLQRDKYDQLEALSMLSEKISETTAKSVTTSTAKAVEVEKNVTPSPQMTIVKETSSVSMKIEDNVSKETSTKTMAATTTTSNPADTTFTTFFSVVDDADDETTTEMDLGKFTTMQSVSSGTEKRMSDRKDEIHVTDSPYDSDETIDIMTDVLNAIGIASDEEDESSSERLKNIENESQESDEVESVISSLSSTLDRTIVSDVNADYTLTSKLASSLMSVADTISETLTGDDDSEETTEYIPITTTTTSSISKNNFVTEYVTDKSEGEEEIVTGEKKEDDITTMKVKETEDTTVEAVIPTTEVIVEETTEKMQEKEQQMGIRKDSSLEEIDYITPPTQTSMKLPQTDGNFVKIENIEATKLSGFKNKGQDINKHIKPIYVSVRSTSTTSTTTKKPTKAPLMTTDETSEISDEMITERVPLIEVTKAPESDHLSSSEENLIEIKVQTKTPPVTTEEATTEDHLMTTSQLSWNLQAIKENIKKTQHQQPRPQPSNVDLSAAPKETLGLAATTASLNTDLSAFSKLCNELAFSFWKSITADGISQARSVIISPFALTSMLSMIFLGARGQTSGEMNDLLKLDDMVTFNPHVVIRNISESIEQSRKSGITAAAFVRELYSDKSKGKLLPYFKEKAQQFYSANVEEVNFNVVNDIIRRRTNLLVKRHTFNKINEYLKTNNIWVNEPLAAVSANVFLTDCSGATTNDRDGEMFFQVSPAIRQRRLVPIPAAVYRSGFTAGYDPILDATAVAFGDELQSTVMVMPGQQGSSIPGDNLERLENAFMDSSSNVWGRLLTTFMERPGLEVQIPRFSHRSLINATYALQQMGLKDIFDGNKADLRGLTGAKSNDLYFSDMLQINQFSTCGEDKIGDSHHIEIYPSPALKRDVTDGEIEDGKLEVASSDNVQVFYDPIYDSRYINVPLPLRPRQARLPENPRLRFDRPFLYFVRHNPTGIILFMGRFNPRLLP